jgi:hypothetical protein
MSVAEPWLVTEAFSSLLWLASGNGNTDCV